LHVTGSEQVADVISAIVVFLFLPERPIPGRIKAVKDIRILYTGNAWEQFLTYQL